VKMLETSIIPIMRQTKPTPFLED